MKKFRIRVINKFYIIIHLTISGDNCNHNSQWIFEIMVKVHYNNNADNSIIIQILANVICRYECDERRQYFGKSRNRTVGGPAAWGIHSSLWGRKSGCGQKQLTEISSASSAVMAERGGRTHQGADYECALRNRHTYQCKQQLQQPGLSDAQADDRGRPSG